MCFIVALVITVLTAGGVYCCISHISSDAWVWLGIGFFFLWQVGDIVGRFFFPATFGPFYEEEEVPSRIVQKLAKAGISPVHTEFIGDGYKNIRVTLGSPFVHEAEEIIRGMGTTLEECSVTVLAG